MAGDHQETLPTLKQLLNSLISESLKLTAPDEAPECKPCNDLSHGDYQCNIAMGLFKILKNKVPDQYNDPRAVAEAILNNIPRSEVIEKSSVSSPGFLNLVLSRSWMEQRIQKMLVDGIETWAPKLPVQRALVDFSPQNVAKEMPFTHFRSTITGETLARMLEFCNVEVLRRNHVCDEKVYDPYIPTVLGHLSNVIVEDDGARVIWVEGFKSHPLIVVKSDGEHSYILTDLAALWYRLNKEKADWIIYVTDYTLEDYFGMLFGAAKRARWLPSENDRYPKTSHFGVGFILGENGSTQRTRRYKVDNIADTLGEAKQLCKEALMQRRGKAADWTAEELEETAEAVGYGAVIYDELKGKIASNYLADYFYVEDNTAIYILYAYARICSIIRKSGRDVEELKKVGVVALDHSAERILGLHLLKFPEVVHNALMDMLPAKLCDYLCSLSHHCTRFYTNCQVIGSEEETSRLLLCEATAVVMRKCFHMLGITPVSKL